MKKAKNALAIIAIVLAVLAAAAAVLNPWFDILAGKAATFGDLISTQITNLLNNLKAVFAFDYFSDMANAIPQLVCLGLLGVGAILFIILFILMLAKKHAKGLGWFFPLLIVYALGAAVVGASRFDNAGYASKAEFLAPQIIGKAVSYVAIGACAIMIVAVIIYMAYVCKARKVAKQIDSARAAAIAKIDSLLGGNN